MKETKAINKKKKEEETKVGEQDSDEEHKK
jgi:hypothetical protein